MYRSFINGQQISLKDGRHLLLAQCSLCVCVCVCACVCACVLVTQSCPTLCNTMDCSPTGSSVHRISQAKILEWVAISFSRGSSHREIKLMSPALAGGFFTAKPPGKPSPTQYAILLSLASSVKTQGPPVPQL